MTHKDEFRARADEDRRQAVLSNLENVRVRLLRSAAAWDEMAKREERVAAAREQRAKDKEAEAADELRQAAS